MLYFIRLTSPFSSRCLYFDVAWNHRIRIRESLEEAASENESIPHCYVYHLYGRGLLLF